MTEEEMVSWHHQLKGHEFEQALGDGEGQGSLVRHSPWCRKIRESWEVKQEGLQPCKTYLRIDSLGKGCVNLSYSQVGRDKPSFLELNKKAL